MRSNRGQFLYGVVCLFAVVTVHPVRADYMPENVGAAACKGCHDKRAVGDQWGKWHEGPHATAWAHLSKPEGLEIAARHGIENPQESPACLKCHTTVGAPDHTLGVQCESCHGAAEKYLHVEIFSLEKARQLGLKRPSAADCKECHSGQCPPDEGFRYSKMKRQIRHSIKSEKPHI